MTNAARETKIAARHIILSVFAVILSLGLTASVTLAGVPTSETAGRPLQGTDQPRQRSADSGGNNALTVGPADCTVTGSITTSDPTHYPVLDTDLVLDTCAGANPCPGEFLAELNYDVYMFNNTSGSAQCVTVTIDATGCGGETSLFSAAYLNNFDPSSLCTNFLGAMDEGTSGTRSYQFNAPANSTFVVLVEPLNEDTTCASYTVSVVGTGITCATGGTATVVMTSTPTRTPTPAVGTATMVNTSTSTVTHTAQPSGTGAPPTNTAIPTNTVVATATQPPCTITFTDVPTNNTFYANIRCLACRGIISGYTDGTFKPNNLVTRGQLAKIVSNAAGYTENPDPQIFEDVPPANTFYPWINRLARRGHMTGYACGGVGEPCTTGRPYFRPFANATRGQTSKIVSNAAGYTEPPAGQTFEDVPPTHTFYMEIQRLASRNIMQGYQCGGVGEPCLSGRPYFRPSNNVTRGQSAKIVANTFFPGCQTP